jgi:hypothetical protein
MPMYRIPASNEYFVQASPYSTPPGLAQYYAARTRRLPGPAVTTRHAMPRRASMHTTRRRIAESVDHSQPAAHGGPQQAMTMDEFLDGNAADHELVSLKPTVSSAALSAAYQRHARRKGNGSTRAIAFCTLGDDVMTKYWRAYAAAFVKGKGGLVIEAKTQADAAAQLRKVRDADVRDVYFVGHGLAPKAGGLKEPAYLLSGELHDGHFSSASYSQLLTAAIGPLMRALAPLLSLERQVIVRFLACSCGVEKRLQAGIAQGLAKLANGIDVRVEGYAGHYMVKKDYSNRAYEEDTRHTDNVDFVYTKTLTRDFVPVDVPPTQLVVEYKSGLEIMPTHEDFFEDADMVSDDPLQGL